MWNPKKIIIKNLMSHTDTEYEFKFGKCVMIYGENESDDGADSNGSGKSVLLEAITLAVTNEVSRDIGRDEFINENSDSCFVSLELSNNSGSVSKLRIEREIFRSKSAKIKIFENDKHNTEITSVNEANSRIFELIGLTKYDILNFFLIGQDKKFSFLTCGDSEKKDIISRFSSTDFILLKSEELKQNNKVVEKSISTIENSIEKLKDKIDFVKSEMKTSSSDFEEKKKINIQKIQSKIDSYEEKIETKQKELKTKQKELKTKQSELSEFDDLDQLVLSNKKAIQKNSTALFEVEELMAESNVNLSHLEHLKEGEISCPECNFKFIINEEISLTDIPEMVLIVEEQIEEYSVEFNLLKKKKKKLLIKKEELQSTQESKLSVKTQISKLKNSIEIISDSIEEMGSELEELNVDLKAEKKSKEQKSNTLSIKEKIKEYKDQKSTLEEQLSAEQDKYEDNQFWIHHFSKKGFVNFLTNKSIKSIEGITNSYLKKINTNLQIRIDGFTELKSGDLSDKISTSILRDGKSVGSFERFSGGEKGRINISNIVGLQKLINMSCPNGGLNFLALDEVFEGLDITGQKETVKILEEIGVTTLVVSHRSKPIGVENELIIRKINGISKISN